MNGLHGKIALVTGGSRGAGRGIAIELAKAGATVYITGRSVKGKSTHQYPGTIDDTVQDILSFGGTAYACRCDHTKDEETAAVIDRIRREQGRLDILVNNAWGGHDLPMEVKPFWELSVQHWDTMFHGGVRAQLVTNHYAVPLMREQPSGLIVYTTFRDQDKYTGTFYYDLAKNALCRMAFGLAAELREHGITVVALSPGWMRTELVLAHHGTDEAHWKEVKALERSESPFYIGRAVCALAGDPQMLDRTGQVLQVGQLAKEYGFTDIDGRILPPFII